MDIRIPANRLYQLIYNYGPSLKPNMSDSDYKAYAIKYKDKIPTEKVRMMLFEKNFSNATPDKKAVMALKKYIGDDKVLELNANLGLWSYLLFTENIDIVATSSIITDIYPLFLPIEKINYIKALTKYSDRDTLLMVCNDNNFINKDIDIILDKFVGNRIILICSKNNLDNLLPRITGTDKKIISSLKHKEKKLNQWMLMNTIAIPQWLNHEYNIYCIEKL